MSWLWVDTAMDGPNPIAVAWSIVRVLGAVRPPRPDGHDTIDHADFAPVLDALAAKGISALGAVSSDIDAYLARMAGVAPDQLSRDEALAFWLNVYNAGALRLAVDAQAREEASVLRVPGGFSRPFITVAGTALSLDAVEHAKVRRFNDPRIHAALVCGSVSCPTLRSVPYSGTALSDQLDDQMRAFLTGGAAEQAADGLYLSMVFRWYGADFVRPDSMPTFVPAGSRRVVAAITPWLSADVQSWLRHETPPIRYQSYDWGLRCAVK